MSTTADQHRDKRILNVPNKITAARMVLAILVFALISFQVYLPALVLFIVAAATDWVDGFYARRYGQVTKVGRVFDPFVDKFIICGAFIFLAVEPNSGIAAWMAVVVVSREMLVTALRSFIEQSGGDFSANISGKLKMVFQCVAVGASIVTLMVTGGGAPKWLEWTLLVSVWLAVLSTIQSGFGYLAAAAKFFRE